MDTLYVNIKGIARHSLDNYNKKPRYNTDQLRTLLIMLRLTP